MTRKTNPTDERQAHQRGRMAKAQLEHYGVTQPEGLDPRTVRERERAENARYRPPSEKAVRVPEPREPVAPPQEPEDADDGSDDESTGSAPETIAQLPEGYDGATGAAINLAASADPPVDLSKITGTGLDGKIRVGDVRDAIAARE